MPFLSLEDTELYYEVHGQGEPFVFLSETHCDGEVWKIYQVPEFAKDHQVITLDYRGCWTISARGRPLFAGIPRVEESLRFSPSTTLHR